MNGRPDVSFLTILTVACAYLPLSPADLSAQETSSRFRVLVSEIQAQAGADKKFGERLADRLREQINEMITHQPIEERELKRHLKEHDLDMDDLDCVRARQLGPLIDAQVVFCGHYQPDANGYLVEVKFLDSAGEEFHVEPFSVPERGQREAAERVVTALQRQSDQARYARFCAESAASQNWDRAEELCRQAIDLNPGAVASRYTLGVVLQKTARPAAALQEFESILELDPVHEEALQWAGNLSATLGHDQRARDYYHQYLQFNPANVSVRMQVAYDLAKAGDPYGAMLIIEEGLKVEPDHVELLKQHGGFAFAAGALRNQADQGVSEEAVPLFLKALASYEKAYSAEGAQMDASLLVNMVKAYMNLGDNEQAAAWSARILETHGAEASVWSIHADALQRTERLEEALAALEHVLTLDPSNSRVAARRGQWLVQAGRFAESEQALRASVEDGVLTPDQAAELLFNYGYQEGIRPEDWSVAIEVLEMAKAFETTDEMQGKVAFFLGYAVLKDAIPRQEARTKESAQATLPLFQEARRLLEEAAEYAQRQGERENDRLALLENVDAFLEIQETILRRGRRATEV